MPARVTPLTELYTISGRFLRSVHIERDELSKEVLDGYRITPIALKTLSRVFAGIRDPQGTRAWSLTGPYGSGKSSFAMFLAALFAVDATKQTQKTARQLLADASPELSCELHGESGRKSPPSLCSVLITGEREPLPRLLLRGLATGLQRIWSKRKPKALSQILARSRQDTVPTTREVVDSFETAIDLVTSKQRKLARGLLVVLDEAGKALEYAAHHPTESDVLLLQELAELAARSEDRPFVFITVFHQAFAGYAARLGPTQRNEWEKVQGRFEDITFIDGWDQSLRLISEAIESHDTSRARHERTNKQISKALAPVELPPVLASADTETLLRATVPLHPYTALLLGPVFRSGVFQNERSLFAFLASQEPSALQHFLATHEAGRSTPLFPLHGLYDYIDNVLQSRATFARPHALRTSEVALQRVPDDAGALGAALTKSIALISWLGEKVGLRADCDTLRTCISPAPKKAEVQACLDALVEASVITYRRFRSSYVVWEGSDIRIDEVIANTSTERMTNERAVALLNTLSPLSPLVARRHLFQTGTLRYFPVEFVAAEQLPERLVKPKAKGGDGNVLLVIHQSEDQRERLMTHLQDRLRSKATGPRPVLCVLPHDSWRLHELLGEYAAVEQLVKDDPRLPHDPVAKREIQARKLDLSGLIRTEVAKFVGLDEGGSAASWHLDEREFRVDNARQLSTLVSEICDEAYHLCPYINNELINRAELSSAAASARRSLLSAMLAKPDEEFFGIDGYPPEKSMYLSLFRSPHRLHGRTKGQWVLKTPPRSSTQDGAIGPAWHAMQEFLDHHADQRIPLQGLYDLLASPPYGIRLGVVPVLFTHFFAINAACLAVYENDAFVPRVTSAIIERLLKAPRNFHIQWFPLSDTRRKLLAALGKALDIKPRLGESEPTVLQVVRRLVRTTAELPRYAQVTKRLSPSTLALRNAMVSAKEPAPLVFSHLPVALGFKPFAINKQAGRRTTEFATQLARGVEELAGAYEALLSDLETDIAESFGVSDLRGLQLQRELGARGARVFPHAIAPKLRAFLIRLVDDNMLRTEWLVSIGTLLAKKPPEHWLDKDYALFRTELRYVRRSFLEMESLTLAEDEIVSGPDTQRRLFRVSVAELGSPHRERVVSLSPAEEKTAGALRDQIEQIVRGFGGELTLDARLAMIGAVTANLIREAEREAHSAEAAEPDHD